MKMKMTAVALALACSTSYAQDSTFDPRSLAMGGTGVTSANIHNAVFHNAAMLASTKPNDDFALEFPIFSVRLLDANNMLNDMKQLSTDASALSTSMTAFQTAVNNFNAVGGQTTQNLSAIQTSAGAAGTSIGAFKTSLGAISGKSLTGNGLLGTVMAIPSKKYAFSLYVDVRADLGAQFNFSAADLTTFGNLSTSLTNCGTATLGTAQATCQNALNGIGANGQVTGLTSSMRVAGVMAKDVGIATARHFDNLGGIDVGIVPKFTMFQTYDYSISAQQTTQSPSLNQGRKDYNAFNMDMGVAKVYKRDSGNEFKTGLALKNMLSKSFTTVNNNLIQVKPQLTLGASYLTKLTTTGIDLDLVANKPMIVGFSKESQFLRLGAEFDAWEWFQLRAGYRHDIKGNYPGLPSVGFGLSPFGLHFDLSVAAASKKEAALSAQLGFNF